ncbi:hypothetical protein ACS3UN_03470 [Oscillospiraceae bacterium LTW-04]|nr:hypothetical protein RBH76_06995 [Oscillospiraceae bacterium MB24-C1]
MNDDLFDMLPERETDPIERDNWWDYLDLLEPYDDGSHCPNCGYPLE